MKGVFIANKTYRGVFTKPERSVERDPPCVILRGRPGTWTPWNEMTLIIETGNIIRYTGD